MAKRKTKFMCQECGYESPKWLGKCPGCGEWNKMVEEVEITGGNRRGHLLTHKAVRQFYQNQCRLQQLKH